MIEIKLELSAKGLSKTPTEINLWRTSLEMPSGMTSTFVIAIQKVVNKFITKVNQHDNTSKDL